MMTARLIIAIVTTALEEAAIGVVCLWLLPEVNVHVPLAVVIAVMLAWLGFAVFSYRMGTRALKKRPQGGLSDMLGMEGEVIERLDPEGMVRVKGETWVARSAGGPIDVGREVTVVGREGLKLIVARKKP